MASIKTIKLPSAIAQFVTKRNILAVMLAASVIWYGVLFFIPKSVEFSYNASSCTSRFTVFPGLQKTTDASKFIIEPSSVVKVGSLPIVATQLCVTPQASPHQGTTQVAYAPFGGWLFRSHLSVEVPKPPVANISPLLRPIAISKPLTLALDKADDTFLYKLAANSQSTTCEPRQAKLSCDLSPLKLEQGQEYHISLKRLFDKTEVKTLSSHKTKTLEAIQVKDSSIKPSEVVYAKPRQFTVALDKPLIKAEASLTKVTGDKKELIKTIVTTEGMTVKIDTPDDLDRASDYVVTLIKAQAQDGSSLAGEYTLPFKVSGGPKVTGINIAKTGVALGAKVIVTFDQELSTTQDTSKLLELVGSSATISKQGNQAIFQLQGAPKCTDLTLIVQKGLLSKYDVAASDQWSQSARTVCHTVATIGTSREGRPIQAYYFGNGTRNVLFMGAIHGNEKSAKYIMDDWINDLEANARTIPADKQVVVVPLVNPDGFYVHGRFNAANVNLNRNFPSFNWVADIQIASGAVVKNGGGTSALSEPETQTIARLTQQLGPELVATYHSQGGLVNSNDVGNAISAGQRYASMTGYKYVSNAETNETFGASQITGTYEDWLIKLGVPVILMELPTNTGRFYTSNKPAMWSLVQN